MAMGYPIGPGGIIIPLPAGYDIMYGDVIYGVILSWFIIGCGEGLRLM